MIYSYKTDRWASQDMRFEVWVEKEALAGVFEPICTELDVPYFPCRGNPSQSSAWEAAQRLLSYNGQDIHILHFGDHDPSGVDMTRDIRDRLEMYGVDFELHRLALNMSQIYDLSPPPNPVKATDSRSPKYVREFGDECWELDVLEPAQISSLVEDAVLRLRDNDQWDEDSTHDEADRECFRGIGRHWDKVRKLTEALDS